MKGKSNKTNASTPAALVYRFYFYCFYHPNINNHLQVSLTYWLTHFGAHSGTINYHILRKFYLVNRA